MAAKANTPKKPGPKSRPPQPPVQPVSPAKATANRHRLIIAALIMAVGFLALVPTIYAPTHGDVRLYEGVANDLLAGKLPYRDRVLEYPPYAIPIFLLPRLFGNQMYSAWFVVLGLFADLIVKCLLFVAGRRQPNILQSLTPLLFYSAAVPFIQFFYLQRYDIWPALVCLLAVWLFSKEHYTFSGLAIAAGIGIKLYPIVFAPPLLLLASRRGKGRPFLVGLGMGLLPIALLSFALPWWHFAQFHGARGLQVESLYASLLWLAKLHGFTQADWAWPGNWAEVHGASASALLPWAKLIWVGMTGLSTAFACWVAMHCAKPSLPQVARIALVPLLGFVAFNLVLSPQYLIWLLPLAALGSLEGNPWIMFIIPLATMLTPAFFPSPQYNTGLNLSQTITLVLRNLLLITTWLLLIRELWQQARLPNRPASP